VGGKTRTDAQGEVPKGWDHDPPAKQKLVPFGILVVATKALTLLFGSYETSDAWVDALQMWWRQVRRAHRHVKRLVIYLDNGPKNSGRRTQFLKRMVQFADWSGLEIHLVYYPPYHSKYNPIERCWSALEQKWNGWPFTGVVAVPGIEVSARASPFANGRPLVLQAMDLGSSPLRAARSAAPVLDFVTGVWLSGRPGPNGPCT
jgi:hypothetical protein